mmetsp:Transcript_52541/g.104432  ORF Transcript_52541/g.104432 Transcript_52541/m.104432 type:complete len:412 (-) Transcript_52541:440-1675(-)
MRVSHNNYHVRAQQHLACSARLVLVSICSTYGRVRLAERNALWALYEATNGANWTNNSHWDFAKDPCRKHSMQIPHRTFAAEPFEKASVFEATPWYGVGCLDPCDDYLDGEGCTAGRIVSLRLRSNGLDGSISGWHGVGEMSNLSYLDLSYNSLQGAVPTELGQINNLESLLLRDNLLSGLLPAEIAMLNANGVGALSELTLAQNSLSGVLPSELGLHAPSMLMLDMTANHLSGSVPEEIAELTALQVLYLRSNSLSGTLPSSLGALLPNALSRPMRYLELQENRMLSGTLPAELHLSELHTMHIQECHLSGTLPTQIGSLSTLHSLKLNDNSISGSVCQCIRMLRMAAMYMRTCIRTCVLLRVHFRVVAAAFRARGFARAREFRCLRQPSSRRPAITDGPAAQPAAALRA